MNRPYALRSTSGASPGRPGPATLILELDADGDAVAGRIGSSSEQLAAFHGWAELAAAIERHRRTAGADRAR